MSLMRSMVLKILIRGDDFMEDNVVEISNNY